jgi:hypothetical protein
MQSDPKLNTCYTPLVISLLHDLVDIRKQLRNLRVLAHSLSGPSCCCLAPSFTLHSALLWHWTSVLEHSLAQDVFQHHGRPGKGATLVSACSVLGSVEPVFFPCFGARILLPCTHMMKNV